MRCSALTPGILSMERAIEIGAKCCVIHGLAWEKKFILAPIDSSLFLGFFLFISTSANAMPRMMLVMKAIGIAKY